MYDEKKIKSIVAKVCKTYKRVNVFHYNGERAEGISFIVKEMVDSWWINRIIEAINKKYPDHEKLGGFRIQSGWSQLPCCEMKEDQESFCVEIRLEYENYGNDYILRG